MNGAIPRNPVGVLQLLGSSQRQVVKDIRNDVQELTNQLRMTALKKMAGVVDRLTRDERKLDSETKETSTTDLRRPAKNKVHTALERFEGYTHLYQFN